LTHPARGGLNFVHGRDEEMFRPNKEMPARGSESSKRSARGGRRLVVLHHT
jgi:hypothetical protein